MPRTWVNNIEVIHAWMEGIPKLAYEENLETDGDLLFSFNRPIGITFREDKEKHHFKEKNKAVGNFTKQKLRCRGYLCLQPGVFITQAVSKHIFMAKREGTIILTPIDFYIQLVRLYEDQLDNIPWEKVEVKRRDKWQVG